MHTLGNIIIFIGVLLFVVTGLGMLTNSIELSVKNISLMIGIVFIFLATGTHVKKPNH